MGQHQQQPQRWGWPGCHGAWGWPGCHGAHGHGGPALPASSRGLRPAHQTKAKTAGLTTRTCQHPPQHMDAMERKTLDACTILEACTALQGTASPTSCLTTHHLPNAAQHTMAQAHGGMASMQGQQHRHIHSSHAAAHMCAREATLACACSGCQQGASQHWHYVQLHAMVKAARIRQQRCCDWLCPPPLQGRRGWSAASPISQGPSGTCSGCSSNVLQQVVLSKQSFRMEGWPTSPVACQGHTTSTSLNNNALALASYVVINPYNN